MIGDQEILIQESFEIKREIESLLHDVEDHIGEVIEKCKKCDGNTDLEKYKIQSIEVVWTIFYINCLWVVAAFVDKNVPFWQIASTMRLLYESVADLSYMLQEKNSKQLSRFFTQLKDKETIDEYMEEMKKEDFYRRTAFTKRTLPRIKSEFGAFGIQQYNILSQFEHVNNTGAYIALESSMEITELRRSIIMNLPGLIEKMLNIIAKNENFVEISYIKKRHEKSIKESFIKYSRDSK